MRCPRCPRLLATPCPGEQTARICELVRLGRDDYRDLVMESLPAPARPPLDSRHRRVLPCAFRSRPQGGSGCRAVCALRGAGGHEVSYGECLACVERYPQWVETS